MKRTYTEYSMSISIFVMIWRERDTHSLIYTHERLFNVLNVYSSSSSYIIFCLRHRAVHKFSRWCSTFLNGIREREKKEPLNSMHADDFSQFCKLWVYHRENLYMWVVECSEIQIKSEQIYLWIVDESRENMFIRQCATNYYHHRCPRAYPYEMNSIDVSNLSICFVLCLNVFFVVWNGTHKWRPYVFTNCAKD